MQTVLIIGANSDVAYETILALAKVFHPRCFYLASKNTVAVQQLSQDVLLRTTIKAEVFTLDLENLAQCENFYGSLPTPPDLVISCAGYLGDQEKAQVSAEEALKILSVNYTGQMLILNQAANAMAEKKIGTIVGVSSVAGLRGKKSNYFYGAAKAAFTAYLSGLRHRLYADNVRVLTVLPGFINTKMTRHLELPEKLTATPVEVAHAIVSALQKSSDVIYVKKIWRVIMGVITLLPERIFKRLEL